MMKFFKGCLITALVLLILGVSIVAVVTLMGDKNEIAEAVYDATEGKVELHLDSWDDFGIHINGDWNMRYDINDAGMFDEDYEVWKGNVEKTKINNAPVEELDIQIGGNSFEVKESQDAFYYIEQEGDGKLQAYEKDGVLYVKALQNEVVIGAEVEDQVILYVPKDAVLQKISVDLGAGTVKASGLEGKDVTFSLGAGSVEWDALVADSLKVEIGAGKLVAKNAELGDVTISLGAGDCEIQGAFEGNVEADCAAGTVSLKVAGKETEFNYDMNCTVGSIQVGATELSEMNEEKKVDNSATKTMELSVAAGNIEVEFE